MFRLSIRLFANLFIRWCAYTRP